MDRQYTRHMHTTTLLTVSVPYIEYVYMGSARATLDSHILPELVKLPCAEWLIKNRITLGLTPDELTTAYSVDITVYADLDTRQYQEWILRFV